MVTFISPPHNTKGAAPEGMYFSPFPCSGLALSHAGTTSQYTCKEYLQQLYEVCCDPPASERTVQQYGRRNEKVLRWADACQGLL